MNGSYHGAQHHPHGGNGDHEHQLNGLFHGLHLGGQYYSGGGNGVSQHQMHSQGAGPGMYGQGSHMIHGGGVISGSQKFQQQVQPVMDIADGGVLTQMPPAVSNGFVGNATYGMSAATFPHLNLHPTSINLGESGTLMNGVPHHLTGFTGMESGVQHMGWGGQAIDNPQSGYKAMWFGKGGMQNRGSNGNRRGRYRGKATNGYNNRSEQRYMNKGRPNFDSGYQYDDPDDIISVESLIDQISQIPKGQQIGQEIYTLMKAMDSRSGASLLKELARIGLVGRAIEIFDHIRYLNNNDPLAQSMQDVLLLYGCYFSLYKFARRG